MAKPVGDPVIENDSYETIRQLRFEINELKLELAEERAIGQRATDLMMVGEGLRHRLMIKAICAGAFNPTPAEVKENHGTDSTTV